MVHLSMFVYNELNIDRKGYPTFDNSKLNQHKNRTKAAHCCLYTARLFSSLLPASLDIEFRGISSDLDYIQGILLQLNCLVRS